MLSINIPIPGLDDVTNPLEAAFKWLAGEIRDLFQALVDLLEILIRHPPRPGDIGNWKEFLFGNALGLAFQIVLLVVALLSCLVIIRPGKSIENLGRGLLTAVFIEIGGNLWFYAIGWAISFGDDLTNAADFYTPRDNPSHGSGLIFIAPIQNIFGSIFGIGIVLTVGTGLLVIVFSYEIFIINAQVFGILYLAFSNMGRIGHAVWRWFVALSIVAIVFGRPIAIIWLELGKMAIDYMPLGASAFGATVYSVAGIVMAIVSQFAFIIGIKEVYARKIQGLSKSRVDGNVNAKVSNQPTVEAKIKKAHERHQQGMMVVKVYAPQTQLRLPQDTIKSDAVKAGSKFIAARAVASGVHPVIGVVVGLTGSALSRKLRRK